MTKAEKLLDAIGEINEEAVRDAKPQRKTDARKRKMRIPLAACACLAAITAFAVLSIHTSKPAGDGYADAGEGGSLPDGDPNGYGPLPGGNPDGYSPFPGGQAEEVSEQDPAEQAQSAEYELSPVYYSDLMLPNGETEEAVLGFSDSYMMDITEFDESTLSQDHCCMIVEGTITNLYVKHYTYDVYSDKFEENGILHAMTDTVVYEIAVDKTWYGEDVSGETIVVEDTSYFMEPILAVKKGMRYVLPLYEYGESIWTGVHEYAGGDITRESRYSTVYPYHPQIEVTEDGFYLISDDWTTLTAKNAREVIMDTMETENAYKMWLVDGDTFAEQMAVLVNQIR